MTIDIDSLLDAEIIKTEEDSRTQTLDVTLLLDATEPIHAHQKKLRFEHVTFYSRSEIPKEGYPVILEISEVVPEIEKSFDNDQSRRRFKIDTTSGIVILEFATCYLVD
ncbi:hypothetical protein [Sphingobacterium sp. BN32]|uniref:hypothetical protein n=1 Tax=Sphingobacterium sp. BN32 TaxID=3058432 RepID=UPI00265D524A|nr:hypothetical protein [Sphingobacterium sp. BN32]WKK59758.1 hypothetical protein QYC40_05850 [Sphingobacterium sp. BN32]